MEINVSPQRTAAIVALLLGFACGGAALALPAVPNGAAALLAQGDQQWQLGQLDAAQKLFETALANEPRSVDAHMKLAGLQLSRQDFKGCIETYQHVIGLDTNNARAWLGLGFSYLHTGKSSLSMAAFNEAIRIDPANKEKLQPVIAKLKMP